MSLIFTPTTLGRLTLANRIVMPPMQQYQGTPEGFATPYHVQHYARRARGGVGLVIVESTAVAPEGRLMEDDVGLFSDAHADALAPVAAAVHAEGAPVLVQLCHGGRKGVPHRGGPLLAPSALPHSDYGMPEPMDATDIASVVAAFAEGAERAIGAGFDGVELHAAHGYLLHQFLSPLSNTRTDDYGGSPQNRARLLAEIVAAVRARIGPEPVVTVRVSASDHAEGGLTADAVAESLAAIVPLGLDAVHVSAGGLLPGAKVVTAADDQIELAAIVRQRLGIPVIAVGRVRSLEAAEAIVARGAADLVAIGRPLLVYPDLSRALALSSA